MLLIESNYIYIYIYIIYRNIKRWVYCQYGQHGLTFRALALRQRENEGPMLETLDYTIRIGSTPTFLYFDLYLYSAYAAHYVYIIYHSKQQRDVASVEIICCKELIVTCRTWGWRFFNYLTYHLISALIHVEGP